MAEAEHEKRKKAIKGLMCIAGDVVFCAHCKYSDVNGSGRGDRCKRDCAKDALALLKAQKAVEAIPVEWISAYMNKAYGRVRAEIIREMLDAWMEQEGR